jgi:hypothetical protein
MLQIRIPSDGISGLNYTKLAHLDIPEPENGFHVEVNNTIVMAFDDEQEAIDYTYQLNDYCQALSDKQSEEFLASRDIIQAIGDDEFVLAYIQSSSNLNDNTRIG